MKSRLTMVLTAVALAALATVGLIGYIQSVKAQIKDGSAPVNVLTARVAIPEGTSVETMRDKDLVENKNIPKRYVAEGAYSDLSQLNNQVLTAPLNKGEQLTNSKMKKSSQASLAYQIPDNFVGISMPVDEIIGVSDQIKQGDCVDILATFSPGPGGSDVSKILLQNVLVLSVSSNFGTKNVAKLGKGNAQGNQKKTLTLALSPADAEKLVFAEEKGAIWLALVPPNNGGQTDTHGQTLESVFR